MATEIEFVTAPSTPELAHPGVTPGAEPPAAAQPDTLQIVVEQRLRQHDGDYGSSAMTIIRVPAHVRNAANKELYEPRLVSVGPYNCGQAELRAMEQHKWMYLHELLTLYPDASLADCVRAVRGVEQQARRCYSERNDILDNDAGNFAEMLLLDGCFVIQYFIRWYYRNEPDNLLCDVIWGLPMLLSDMLLLENQIPFFVLEALFTALFPATSSTRTLGLLKLIVPRFKLYESTFCTEVFAGVVPTQADEIDHLLHLLYEALVPRAEEQVASLIPASPPPLAWFVAWMRQKWLRFKTAVSERFAFVRDMVLLHKVSAWFSMFLALIGVNTRMEPSEPQTGPEPMLVPSATQLREAGVRFEKKASPRHMFDITFDASRGVLRMPRMKVDHADKPQLVNLIAFEQTRGLRGNSMLLSSYGALLGSLLRTAEDVEHLQRHGVIDCFLSSVDDEATRFFQQLGRCSSLLYDNHHFAHIFRGLRQHYHSRWRRHKAKFLRDHCSSPWTVLAFIVAGCVFCFALVTFSTTIYGIAHRHCRHC